MGGRGSPNSTRRGPRERPFSLSIAGNSAAVRRDEPSACHSLCTALRVANPWQIPFPGRWGGRSARTGGLRGCPVPPAQRGARTRMIPALWNAYLPLVIFVGVALVIGAVLLIVPFVIAYKQPDPEKLSAYECGFNAFDDARMKFDVRYYLVAILFIIFDLEVTFLFPWAVA